MKKAFRGFSLGNNIILFTEECVGITMILLLKINCFYKRMVFHFILIFITIKTNLIFLPKNFVSICSNREFATKTL